MLRHCNVYAFTLFLAIHMFPAVLRAEEGPVLAPEDPCGPQDYDGEQPPDFTCPGPEERDLRPELHPPDAVAVRQGWVVVDAEGELRLSLLWDGAVVHRDRLIEAGLWLYTVRRLRWADRLRLSREYDIRLHHAEEMGQARLDHMEAQRDAYEERWRIAEQRVRSAQTWWRSPVLWFAVGVVAT